MNFGHARSTTGVLEDKGAIDCSANPNYPAATAGQTYRVSVAGKIGGASGVDVLIGDVIRCKTTSASAGNHATVGANFDIAGSKNPETAISCSANPNYPAASAGQVWRVSVAGKIGGGSGVDVLIGDLIRCKTSNAGGTHASVGANFDIVASKNSVTAIDCSSNPNYPAANAGQTFRVSVAGKIGGASGLPVLLGDLICCKNINAGGTEASVGVHFDVLSVRSTPAAATAALSVFGPDSGTGGTKGLVPAPGAGDTALKKSLMPDATWGYGIFGLDGNKFMYTADSAVASSGSYSTTGMSRLTTVRHSTPGYGYREMYVKLGNHASSFDIADSVQGSWYDVNGGYYFAEWWLALSPKKGFKRNTTTGLSEVVSPDTRTGYGGAGEINFQNRWAADAIKYKATTFGTTGGMGTVGLQIVPEAQDFDAIMGADGYHLNAALLIGRSTYTSSAISDKAKSHICILLDPNSIAPDGVGICINGNDADTGAGGSADASKSPLSGIELRQAFDIGIDCRSAITHTATMIAIPDLYRVTWAYDGGTDQVDLTSATDSATKKLVCNKRFDALGFLTGGHILPKTTEVYDLGSASFEFNNAYLQNAVTVSDMRRKNDLGEIDGDQALSLINNLIPRWFTFKDRVTPAHTRIESQTRDVAVPAKTERQQQKEKFTDENGVEQTRMVMVDVLIPEHIEQRLVEVEVDIDEQVVTHGRPHAGFFAQQVKEAMTAAGIEDFAGYAYDPDTDTHLLRLLEMVAILTAGIKRQNERIDALTALIAGGVAPPPRKQPEPEIVTNPPQEAGFSLPEEPAPEPELVAEPELVSEPGPLDLNEVPDVLKRFVEADETPAEFRIRLKSLWQRFGIEDGKHFPGGGEALSGEEKILMGDLMGVMNAHLFAWMKPNE